jgi:intracellular sulfur oxidation DsrE/DsrF family protein
MKKLTLLALTVFTILSLSPIVSTLALAQTPASAPVKTHRVVFAVTSGDEADWNLTLGNIRNLIAGLKPDPYEIEVVAFGPGISVIKADSTAAKDIAALQTEGVKFMACQNAMRMRHLELKDLVPAAIPVPAGIVEVVTKQEQGWIYIKGGR